MVKIDYEIMIVSYIKKGDIKAYERLFRQYYIPLCRYAESIIGNREDAQEIVEDLFYYLWQKRKELNIFQSIKNYLYISVRNRCLQYYRSKRYYATPQEIRSEFGNSPASPSPEEEIEYKELQRLMEKRLAILPERCQQIYDMHRNQGMKYADIATALGISIKTVEANISKALNALRKEVESYYK